MPEDEEEIGIVSPVEQPEYYTGYTKELQQLGVEYYRASKSAGEAQSTLESLSRSWGFTIPLDIDLTTGRKVINILPFLNYYYYPSDVYKERLVEAQTEYDVAIQNLKSAEWKQTVMNALPNYLALSDYKILKAEDILNYLPLDSIDDADRTWLSGLYSNLSYLSNTLPEGYTGDAMKAQSKVLNEILTAPKLEVAGVHSLTVDELAKSFQFGVAELPEGMTEQDVRDVLSEMEIEDEGITEVKDWLTEQANSWALETDRLNLIRAGITQAESPELTPGEFIKLMFTQPMLAASELIDKYSNILPRPVATAALIGLHNLFNTSEDTMVGELEQNYEYYKSTGESSWSAYAMAFNEWDASWIVKMGAEIAFDPTTYIGFGLIKGAGTKIGGVTRASRTVLNRGSRIGNLLIDFETGYVAGADALFQTGKEVVLSPVKGMFYLTGAGYGIPRTLTQMSRNFARSSMLDLSSVASRTFPDVRSLKGLTAKDIIDVGSNAIDNAIARPMEGYDLSVKAGANLLEFEYLDNVAASRLVKEIAEGATFDTPRLARLNNEVLNMFSGQGSKVTAGKIVSDLGIEATEDAVKKLSNRLDALKQKVADSAKDALKGDTANDVLLNTFKRLEDTRYSNLSSPLTKHMEQAGRAASWHSRVADRVLYSTGLVWLERRAVMPMAKLNLLFMNFGPANYAENMMRGFLGGGDLIYPKSYGGVAETNRLFTGLSNAPYELVPFERGEVRLSQALVSPETGKTTVFKSGNIPFVTKDITVPEWMPLLGGKPIGVNYNIAGRNYFLGSFQDQYNMFGMLNANQVAWDYQTHYMKSLAEVAPEEMSSITKSVLNNRSKLNAISSISSKDARDIERTLIQDATRNPSIVRGHSTLTALEFDRRQIAKEINRGILSQATDVSHITKNNILDEVLDGTMFAKGTGSIDDRIAAHLSAERESSLLSLKNQTEVLKKEVDAFIANPPKNMQEFMGDMQNVTALIDATAEQIHYYRSITELRKAKLSPADLDNFEVGSAKLLAEYMDTSEEQLTKMLNQLTDNARIEGVLTDAQIARLEDLTSISRLEMESTLATRTKIADIESKIPKTPKRSRNDRFWHQQRAAKASIWDEFDKTARKMKDMRLRASRNFLQSVDQPVFIPDSIPEVVDKLTPNHLAYLYGCTGDDLYRGLTRVQHQTVIRPREDFILYTKNQADAYAAKFEKTAEQIGFTDDAIGEVYDQLWRNMGIEPTLLTPDSPTVMQMEEMRQEIHRLYATNKIPDTELVKWKEYVSSVADDLEKLPMYQKAVAEAPAMEKVAPILSGSELVKYNKAVSRMSELVEYPTKGTYDTMYHVGVAKYTKSVQSSGLATAGRFDLPEPFSGEWDAVFLTQDKDFALEVVHKIDLEGKPAYIAEVNTSGLDLWSEDAFAKGKLTEDVYSWFHVGRIPRDRIVGLESISATGGLEKIAIEPAAKPAAKLGAASGTADWWAKKESAMAKAREMHSLSFPTYDDANIIDETMRAIFPFWNYESFRMKWIPRTWLRTPGTMTGLARWMQYTDDGYVSIPGTDLQINPLRGSIWMGGLRSLWLKDYPEYYDNVPGMEAIDYISRLGFFPGIHVMLPIVIWGASTGKPEFSELAPAFVRTGLSALRQLSPEHIGKVLDIIYPDRFRDYQTMLTLAEMGYDADEIWTKKKLGEKLTADEEKLWLQAEGRVDGIKGILMQQTGVFRIRPQEYTAMRQELRLAIEEATGVPVSVQERIDKLYPTTGKRFSDYYKLDVLQTKLLYEWETYRRWQGVAASLEPAGWQQMDARITEYFSEVERIYEEARTTGVYEDDELIRPSIVDINRQFVNGEISADQWRSSRADIISGTAEAARVLGESAAYKDVPKTFEERAAYLAEKGVVTPTKSPDQELLYYYYELKPEYKYNWETGANEYDYDTYYAYIDILLESLSKPFRDRLLERIQIDWTPIEKLYWQVSRDYFRAYRNLRNTVLSEYPQEYKQLILQYESADYNERQSLQNIVGPDGDALISGFQTKLSEARQRLRILSPDTDAWLNFFGVTTGLLSKNSKTTYNDITKKYKVEEMVE